MSFIFVSYLKSHINTQQSARQILHVCSQLTVRKFLLQKNSKYDIASWVKVVFALPLTNGLN